MKCLNEWKKKSVSFVPVSNYCSERNGVWRNSCNLQAGFPVFAFLVSLGSLALPCCAGHVYYTNTNMLIAAHPAPFATPCMTVRRV